MTTPADSASRHRLSADAMELESEWTMPSGQDLIAFALGVGLIPMTPESAADNTADCFTPKHTRTVATARARTIKP